MNDPQVKNEAQTSTGEKVVTVGRVAAVIALALSLLPAVIIYTRASNELAILGHTVNQLAIALDDQREDRQAYRLDIDSRLRTVEDRLARGQQDLAHALSTLDRIDNRLERLEERLLNGQGASRQ